MIPDSMRVGPPLLRVRNIDTVIAFYENSLGLQANKKYKDNNDEEEGKPIPIYELGFKHNISYSYEPLLLLKHDPNAK